MFRASEPQEQGGRTAEGRGRQEQVNGHHFCAPGITSSLKAQCETDTVVRLEIISSNACAYTPVNMCVSLRRNTSPFKQFCERALQVVKQVLLT